ncbi:MAG: class I SAM-dependent methyltransferase [Pseudomonadota bacterium]
MKRILLLIGISLFGLTAAGCSERASRTDVEPAQDAELIEEELNLDVWLERLEVGSRELYSAREAVVAAADLKPGDWVADVGAGTGLYSLLFAEAVGPDGQVFAEDIEPLFLELIARRAADSDIENVTAVLGRVDDVTLPDNSVDVVFIADTYHYFDDREAVMRSILQSLKPGGSLVLVEFDLVSGADRPDYKSHVRFGKNTVISEIEFIGFELAEDRTVEGLQENYFIRFIKPSS